MGAFFSELFLALESLGFCVSPVGNFRAKTPKIRKKEMPSHRRLSAPPPPSREHTHHNTSQRGCPCQQLYRCGSASAGLGWDSKPMCAQDYRVMGSLQDPIENANRKRGREVARTGCLVRRGLVASEAAAGWFEMIVITTPIARGIRTRRHLEKLPLLSSSSSSSSSDMS